MLQDIASNKDYLKLIKAVLDSAAVDYVKLQHPKNRTKKSAKISYANSVAIFFNEEFRFEHFVHPLDETYHFSTKELLSALLSTNKIDLKPIQDELIEEAISYWWEKNFHDMSIPNTISLAGKVFTVVQTSEKPFINYQDNSIHCNKTKRGADRIFFQLCLDIILNETGIELSKKQKTDLFKLFYLFLKVNSAFQEKKK